MHIIAVLVPYVINSQICSMYQNSSSVTELHCVWIWKQPGSKAKSRSRYIADTSVRFQRTCATTQGACRALGCGTLNPRSSMLQASGLWAWWPPVALWHGHQDGAAIGVRQLCLPHTQSPRWAQEAWSLWHGFFVFCFCLCFSFMPWLLWLVNTFDSIMSSSFILLDLSLYVWNFLWGSKTNRLYSETDFEKFAHVIVRVD